MFFFAAVSDTFAELLTLKVTVRQGDGQTSSPPSLDEELF